MIWVGVGLEIYGVKKIIINAQAIEPDIIYLLSMEPWAMAEKALS